MADELRLVRIAHADSKVHPLNYADADHMHPVEGNLIPLEAATIIRYRGRENLQLLEEGVRSYINSGSAGGAVVAARESGGAIGFTSGPATKQTVWGRRYSLHAVSLYAVRDRPRPAASLSATVAN
ncbi:MAG: hypothetical protein OXR66_01250 [Candidatus Woesearchaeota archaeon]|nr:hypothetical protein [Candidatus Woesearchaeota archaeon]